MALAQALVDRARVLSVDKTAARVEGTKIALPVTGPWFRARLTLRSQPQSPLEGGRTRVVQTPELLYLLTDETGEAVELSADDKLEIESADLGTAVWQVNGEPEIMRRKRGLVGGLVHLKRVKEASA